MKKLEQCTSTSTKRAKQHHRATRNVEPTPPTPEVSAEPGKPVPPAKEEPKKPSKPVEQGKVVTPVIEINEKVKAVAPTKKPQSKKSELPETGGEESTNKGMLFGGLFSILGLTLLRRNKKNHKA